MCRATLAHLLSTKVPLKRLFVVTKQKSEDEPSKHEKLSERTRGFASVSRYFRYGAVSGSDKNRQYLTYDNGCGTCSVNLSEVSSKRMGRGIIRLQP